MRNSGLLRRSWTLTNGLHKRLKVLLRHLLVFPRERHDESEENTCSPACFIHPNSVNVTQVYTMKVAPPNWSTSPTPGKGEQWSA